MGFYPSLFVSSRPPVYKTRAWNKWKFVGPPPQSWILFLKGISWLICAAKTPRCQLLGSAKGVQTPMEQHRAGCPPIAPGKHPPASLTLFLGSFLAFFTGFFPKSHSAGRNSTAEPCSSLERGREREIIYVGIVLLLPFFAFKITFKENILVLTRIYLLYSCIWLLAWVPNRQRSGLARFKAKTCNEKRFFFPPFLFLSKAGF